MLVNNKVINEDKLVKLISKIKEKKELNEISDDFVRDQLFIYFRKKPKSISFLEKAKSTKSTKYKQIVKEVRGDLRRVYGLFRKEDEAKQRRELFEIFLKSSSLKKKVVIEEILKTHSSTRERLNIYQKLYKKIFTVTGKPKKIIDFGSGVNPFSFTFMNLKNLNYFAYDISNDEINLVNKYFNHLNQKNGSFQGVAEVLDIKKMSDLPDADVCFMFKMTDVLDRGKGHKITEEIIIRVPVKYVIVSFPTLTMSGKRMNYPRRKWIELMCQRLNFYFRTLEYENEIFYVIKK